LKNKAAAAFPVPGKARFLLTIKAYFYIYLISIERA